MEISSNETRQDSPKPAFKCSHYPRIYGRWPYKRGKAVLPLCVVLICRRFFAKYLPILLVLAIDDLDLRDAPPSRLLTSLLLVYSLPLSQHTRRPSPDLLLPINLPVMRSIPPPHLTSDRNLSPPTLSLISIIRQDL